jgi:hypothetical protein
MSTIATMRPSSTVQLGSGWAVTGAASASAATSDDSDSSYVACSTGSGSGQVAVAMAFPSFSVTTKALTSNVATLTTSIAHTLNPNEMVTVAGVDATFNGTWRLVSVTSTTISYNLTAANVASTSATGTVTFAGIPALAQILAVTARYRGYATDVESLPQQFQVGSGALGATQIQAGTMSTTMVNATWPSVSTNPSGNAWSAADLSALNLWVGPIASDDTGLVLAEFYVDVLYNEAPSAFITAPSGTVTTTTEPAVTWTYSDPENDSQERYVANLYSSATVTAGSVSVSTKELDTNTATLTTATPHGLAVGDTINVNSVGAPFDGNWIVSRVGSPTAFSYPDVAAAVTSVAATGYVFSPDVTAADQTSGVVFSPGLSWTPTAALANGNYTYYVKVADTGSNGRYGEWNGNAFTLSLAIPTSPTIAVTVNSAALTVAVTVSQPALTGFTLPSNAIQQSDDGGVTWTTLYGSPILTPSASGVTVTDYAKLVGTSRQYRANVTATNASGYVLTSPWTASVTASFSAINLWSIRDPYVSANTITNAAVAHDTENQIINQGVFDPIGRSLPVIVQDSAKGWDGNLNITIWTNAQEVQCEALAKVLYPLLLSSPSGENRWIQWISPIKRTRQGLHFRVYTFPFRQVPNPLNGNTL